jgi:hypothetical protein
MLRKDEIGPARKVIAVQSETIAHPVRKPSDNHLWLGAAGTNRRHKGGTLFRGEAVHWGFRAYRV